MYNSTRMSTCCDYVRYACINGHLECLKKFRTADISKRAETCVDAAIGGNVECLKYLREIGCGWDYRTTTVAAERGYLECLKYAHENGCPWDKTACLFAARTGQLECLIYARMMGCPWDYNTCQYAVHYMWYIPPGGHYVQPVEFAHGMCLMYAHREGASHSFQSQAVIDQILQRRRIIACMNSDTSSYLSCVPRDVINMIVGFVYI